VEPVALPLHPRDDVPDAAPVIDAAVQELELRRARLEGEEVEGGAEQSATSILITTGVASPPLQVSTVTRPSVVYVRVIS